MDKLDRIDVESQMLLMFEREYLIRERQLFSMALMSRSFFAGIAFLSIFFQADYSLDEIIIALFLCLLFAAFWVKGELDARSELFQLLRYISLISEEFVSERISDYWVRRNYLRYERGSIVRAFRLAEPLIWAPVTPAVMLAQSGNYQILF